MLAAQSPELPRQTACWTILLTPATGAAAEPGQADRLSWRASRAASRIVPCPCSCPCLRGSLDAQCPLPGEAVWCAARVHACGSLAAHLVPSWTACSGHARWRHVSSAYKLSDRLPRRSETHDDLNAADRESLVRFNRTVNFTLLEEWSIQSIKPAGLVYTDRLNGRGLTPLRMRTKTNPPCYTY